MELDVWCPDSRWPLECDPLGDIWCDWWGGVPESINCREGSMKVYICVWIWNSKLGMMTTWPFSGTSTNGNNHVVREMTNIFDMFVARSHSPIVIYLWHVSILLSYRNRLSEVWHCHSCLLDLPCAACVRLVLRLFCHITHYSANEVKPDSLNDGGLRDMVLYAAQ